MRRFNTVDFVNGDGARWDSASRRDYRGNSTWTHVFLHGIGHIKVNQHRPVTGRVKQVSVKREGSLIRPRWYVVVACDDVPPEPLDPTGATVGLDLATGANGLAYLSDGTVIANPRAFHRIQTRLAAAQREAEATRPRPFTRASARHKRALDRVRALHAKAARIRADHLHKTARMLVNHHDVGA